MSEILVTKNNSLESKEESKEVYKEEPKEENNIAMSTIVLIGFVIIFMIIVPYWLSLTKDNHLFFNYITNVDILAAIFAWRGGLPSSKPMRHLYNPADETPMGLVSYILISVYTLCALLYFMAYRMKHSNFVTAWARTTMGITLTFFIANIIVKVGMDSTYDWVEKFINNHNNVDHKNEDNTLNPIAYWITFCVGLALMVIIIRTEMYINTHYIKYLFPFFTPIHKFIQHINPKATH
jgi:hypothetical protein